MIQDIKNRIIKAFNILTNNRYSYKKTFKRDDIEIFFNEIEKRLKAYLQVTLLKPDTLVESGDTSFNYIDIYKHYNDIDDDEKVIFYNQINTYRQNYVNSFYVTVNDFYFDKNNKKINIQPLTFSIWYLGSELRIGCFFNPEILELMGIKKEEASSMLKTKLKIFEGISYESKNGSVNRNTFILEEKIISPKDFENHKILENQEFLDYTSQLFSNFVSGYIKYYFEKTRSTK